MRLSPSNSFTLAAAAVWAAAELILGLTLGGFLEAGRAETVAFITFRPFLLLLAAALAIRWPWRRRVAFYLLALLAAGVGESLLVLRLGSADPWTEMLRAFGASLLLLVVADLILHAVLRWLPSGRTGTIILFILGGLLALSARAPWTVVFMAPDDGPPAEAKPGLLLMTSLPIVWGEYGAFDPRSRPSETYRVLQEEFDVRPIDTLDERSLARNQLLLLAQPRWLAPSELVALDDWVRKDGRVFILADPKLDWSSDLPIGDVRRPVPTTLLGPLLAHWGLTISASSESGRDIVWIRATEFNPRRKVVVESPGRFEIDGGECSIEAGGLLAGCVIGTGSALLMADADVMRDNLWTAPGPKGAARHRRTADNPLALIDLLEKVGQLGRERPRRPVAWADPSAPLAPALSLALLPTLLLLALALVLALLRRIRPHAYPQAYKG